MRDAAFSLLSLFLFSYECRQASAIKLRLQRPSQSAQSGVLLQGPHASSDVNNNLINKDNERYTANITVNGRVVNVALDTGSTDLWVMPPEGLTTFNDTGLNATLEYGDGSDFVIGDIGVGTFELNQYSIPAQAFLNVRIASKAEKPDFDAGIFGLWGLGFNTPGSSRINDAVQKAFGASETWGQSVLANIFAQHPTGSDYIGISLSRTGDQEGTADASLTISEYDSDYEAVQNAPKIPQFPQDSGAWTVLLDALTVNGKKIDWTSSVVGTPAGKTIVDLDTGTTNIMMPRRIVNAIYSSIPGAVLSPNSRVPSLKFSTTNDVWVVPCNATFDMKATFGGQDFPIHPLDATDMQVITSPDGRRNYTACVGAFTDIGTILDDRGDALFGDSFLRNVYTVFDFGTGGTTKGAPFVQMLSNTDATKTVADLLSVRAKTMAGLAPELAPVDLVMIFNGSMPSGNTGAPSTGSGGGKGGGRDKDGGAISYSPSLSLALGLLAIVSFAL
ncbi:aspartic peptidase domain-containing protein [Mycena rebaudengoi]|nr:aspartic peptidase domain-containing protein [Mycena rebaudengoi]